MLTCRYGHFIAVFLARVLGMPPDQDGDGRLGYHDFAWLAKAIQGEDLPEETFDKLCEQAGATDKLITKDQLYVMEKLYERSIEEDLDKLRALQTKGPAPQALAMAMPVGNLDIRSWLILDTPALEVYTSVFVDAGYDDTAALKDIECEEEHQELLANLDAAGIKRPHRRKIVRMLNAITPY